MAQEATALFDAHAAEVEIVLLDVVMPKLGGPGVYKHIRNTNQELPILFTTGYSPTELDPLLQHDPRAASFAQAVSGYGIGAGNPETGEELSLGASRVSRF